jgi:hypothetical protein
MKNLDFPRHSDFAAVGVYLVRIRTRQRGSGRIGQRRGRSPAATNQSLQNWQAIPITEEQVVLAARAHSGPRRRGSVGAERQACWVLVRRRPRWSSAVRR